MLTMLFPMVLVVLANTFYHICTNSTPGDTNAFASLTVTYLVAAALSCLLFFLGKPQSVAAEFGKLNWTSWVLGAAIVALEFGFIQIYRVGWPVSIGSLIANISLACVLLFVGALLYHEQISPRQLIGVGVCIIGLILVSKK